MFGGCVCESLLIVWILVLGDIVKDIDEVECMLVVCCYKIFKFKIGCCEVEVDVVYVVVIKKVFGDCGLVWVDVNMVWSELEV